MIDSLSVSIIMERLLKLVCFIQNRNDDGNMLMEHFQSSRVGREMIEIRRIHLATKVTYPSENQDIQNWITD
jgi:hypothetical protein